MIQTDRSDADRSDGGQASNFANLTAKGGGCTIALIYVVVGKGGGPWGITYQNEGGSTWAPLACILIRQRNGHCLSMLEAASGLKQAAMEPQVLDHSRRPGQPVGGTMIRRRPCPRAKTRTSHVHSHANTTRTTRANLGTVFFSRRGGPIALRGCCGVAC